MSENSSDPHPEERYPDEDEPAEDLVRSDPEAPEADALDQAREVAPGARRRSISRPIDASDADAIEQAIEVPIDPDDER
jgi:hypothetical protein